MNCATYPVVASVFTSSNVEITIDVVTRDTTVKATSFTTVSRQTRPMMTRSHDRVTRPSSTGDSKRVETAGDDGAEPLTAVDDL